MARLSDLAGQYQQTGGLLQHSTLTAVGGETSLPLTFTDGNEEVYLNGSRLINGATSDYTTTNGMIWFNEPLGIGDVVLLIGRSASSDIAQTRGSAETVVTGSVQFDPNHRTIIFSTIETDPLVVFISGLHVDNGQLAPALDYTVVDSRTITLRESYPEGTQVTGVQGNRTAWVDPSSMVVNDGTSSKDLSSRFRDTMESLAYFRWSNGRQIQNISTNLTVSRWLPTSIGLSPDPIGEYPVIQVNGVLYNPTFEGVDDYNNIPANGWTVSGRDLTINCTNKRTGAAATLTYTTRIQ